MSVSAIISNTVPTTQIEAKLSIAAAQIVAPTAQAPEINRVEKPTTNPDDNRPRTAVSRVLVEET